MSFSDYFENKILESVFKNQAFVDTSVLNVALHTADPGEGGTQSTNEAGYTGYQRVATGPNDWTVTGNVASPTNPIRFPTSSGGTVVACTHVSVGLPDGNICAVFTLDSSITPSNGLAPEISSSSTFTLD